MKLLEHFLGVLCAFCLMIIFLITSVEAVAYWTPGYYEHEYSKYNVTEAVRMEMDDLLEVTDEMMAYLRGNREDLHVDTIVNGEPREFFNAREIAHMEDVRGAFHRRALAEAHLPRRRCHFRGPAVSSEGRRAAPAAPRAHGGDRPVFPHHRRAGRAHIHRLHEIFRDFPPYFL